MRKWVHLPTTRTELGEAGNLPKQVCTKFTCSAGDHVEAVEAFWNHHMSSETPPVTGVGRLRIVELQKSEDPRPPGQN